MSYADFDRAVVGQYQKLINLFGVSRLLLVEVCAAGYSVIGIPAMLMSDIHFLMKTISGACYLAVSWFCVRDSKSTVRYPERHRQMRTIFLLIALMNFAILLTSGPTLKVLAYFVSDFLAYSAYAMCDCQDPPPPKKKPKLLLNPST